MVNKEKLIEIFKSIEDPEIHLDIWTLGLIYDVKIEDKVFVKMTFTSPMCPFGPQLVEEVSSKIKNEGVEVEVEVTFDPPWEPSEELRDMLGV